MNALRVVSLLPSATEILHALGLGAFQVGRSHECDFPTGVNELPSCTQPMFDVAGSSREIDLLVQENLSAAASIYAVDAELLRQLRPTHVLTQTFCNVCAVSLADVESALGGEDGEVEIVDLRAGSLDGLWQDIQRTADALGVASAGRDLISSLQSRMSEMEQRALSSSRRPRVAAIEWIDPLMAAGNWVPELIARAGGENLFGSAGVHSPWMNWDDLHTADPDVIVALPCGFDLERTRLEMKTLTCCAGWADLTAVRSDEVYICDGNQFMNRSGPRLVESLQIFGEIFHPGLFAPALSGVGWERWRFYS